MNSPPSKRNSHLVSSERIIDCSSLSLSVHTSSSLSLSLSLSLPLSLISFSDCCSKAGCAGAIYLNAPTRDTLHLTDTSFTTFHITIKKSESGRTTHFCENVSLDSIDGIQFLTSDNWGNTDYTKNKDSFLHCNRKKRPFT